MIIPEYLKKNDNIGIVAPARQVSIKDVEECKKYAEQRGYNVIYGNNLFGKNNQFSGTDEERAADLQFFLDNPDIKAIICARGGYGTVRLLPYLNFNKFIAKPKWIVGFSDITVLHSVMSKINISSIHAPMCLNYSDENFDKGSIEKTFDLLEGKSFEYSFPSNVLNKQGISRGVLVGGNLSVLYSLRATDYDLDTSDKILFFEDIDEYLYHIDRMIMNLRIGGFFNRIRGLIVGEMKDMKDNTIQFGKNAYEIIAEHVNDYEIPVCYGLPAGHGNVNYPLILGQEVELRVEKECKLSLR